MLTDQILRICLWKQKKEKKKKGKKNEKKKKNREQKKNEEKKVRIFMMYHCKNNSFNCKDI